MKEFFQTLLEKAKDIKSVDDVFALAQEYGIDIDEETAKEYFDKVKGKINLGSLGGLFNK